MAPKYFGGEVTGFSKKIHDDTLLTIQWQGHSLVQHNDKITKLVKHKYLISITIIGDHGTQYIYTTVVDVGDVRNNTQAPQDR